MRAILTFHGIDDSGSVLSYPPRAFAHLVDALGAADLPILTLDELLAPTAARGVALTFDDGLRSVATAALPVLRERNLPAHLFLTTGAVGGDNIWPGGRGIAPRMPMLDWDQVERLHAGGVRIESHTLSHPDLRTLDDAAIRAECDAADRMIAARLERPPRYFAYPFGYSDARVRRVLRAHYAAAVTTELRPLRREEDMAALPRLDSYYLQARWLQDNLESRPARAYLALRHLLRRLRRGG